MTKLNSPKTCEWCGKTYTETAAYSANRYCCQKCEAEAKAAGKR